MTIVVSPDAVYANNAESVERSVDDLFVIEEDTVSTRGMEIPNKKALMVGDNVINIVSDRYNVVQPRTVYESFKRVEGVTINKMLTNPHTGGLLLASTIQGNDDYSHDLVFYTGHNGQYRTVLTLQTLRMACMNQCPTLLANKSQHLISAKHYQFLDFKHMSEIIKNVPTMVNDFQTTMGLLEGMNLTFSKFAELYMEKEKITDSRKDKVKEKLEQTYYCEEGQSVLPNDSAIKAFNTITFMNTHNVRKSKSEMETRYLKKMGNSHSWYGVLTEAS